MKFESHIGQRVQEELAFKQIIHDFLFLALVAIFFTSAKPFSIFGRGSPKQHSCEYNRPRNIGGVDI